MGRVSYLYGFISALAELLDPFHKLLKTNVLLQQSSRQRQVFQKVKYVFSSTLTMILPIKSLPLTIFFDLYKQVCWCFACRWGRMGRASSILLSRSFRVTKMNCSSIEHNYLALIFAIQNLRHCVLAHFLDLVMESTLKYLLSQSFVVSTSHDRTLRRLCSWMNLTSPLRLPGDSKLRFGWYFKSATL